MRNIEYYIFEHNDEIIDHDSDPNALRKRVAEALFPDEPGRDVTEIKIYTENDSLYLEGKFINLADDAVLLDILTKLPLDVSGWELIETECTGHGVYRAIYHKIN